MAYVVLKLVTSSIVKFLWFWHMLYFKTEDHLYFNMWYILNNVKVNLMKGINYLTNIKTQLNKKCILKYKVNDKPQYRKQIINESLNIYM